MNIYTKIAFAINDIGAGHTKEAFGTFAAAVGGKLLGQAKNILPRFGAFFGKHVGEGASALRTAEKALHLANQGGKAVEIGAARQAYNAALNVGKQKQYQNFAKDWGQKLHGNKGFDPVTGKQLASAQSLQGGVDAAYKNLSPGMQKTLRYGGEVAKFVAPTSALEAFMLAPGVAGLGNKADAIAEGRAQGVSETTNAVAEQLDALGGAGIADRFGRALKYVGNPTQMNQYADNLRNYAASQDHYN